MEAGVASERGAGLSEGQAWSKVGGSGGKSRVLLSALHLSSHKLPGTRGARKGGKEG